MDTSSSSSSSPTVMDIDDNEMLLFRCPISMELMTNPVTISTGVTYERKNIEKWLFVYKKTTCPTTMQRLDTFDLTPNHTLKRLISSWQQLDPVAAASPSSTPSTPSPSTTKTVHHDELVSLLRTIESSPFKVGSLKKLRSEVAADDKAGADLVKLGGIEVLGQIIHQILAENNDFASFQASEEAMAVLHLLPLPDESSIRYLMTTECLTSMVILLQRGTAEARLHTVTILHKIARTSRDWSRTMAEQGIEFYKSLLDLLSDEISTWASSCAMDVLAEIMTASKKKRLRAVEAGAVRTLVELLPEGNRHKCEKLLLLLKLLCECPEGRSAFADHGMGIAAVSKKILRVSETATKVGVKVLWLVCSFLPTDKVLDEMMVFGALKKMLGLLHVDGMSSTKETVIKMLKLHGGIWQQYPCFPFELKDYLIILHDHHHHPR